MSERNRIELRLSKARSRLREIAALDTDGLTPEIREESDQLVAAVEADEIKLRASLAAEPEPGESEEPLDAETRERLELRGRARVGRYMLAAVRGRLPAGVEAEYNAACGFEDGGIPLEMWEPEQRAVTNAPTGTNAVGVNVAPIQPHIFAPSIAADLMIDMPMVESGTFSQARISTPLTASALAKGGDAEATAAAFTVASGTPKRVSCRLEFLVEDVASAGVANFEAALRENLSMALSAELDDQLINGSGVAPNLSGLLKALGDATTDKTLLTYSHGIEKLAGLVDGLFAMNLSQIYQLVGVETYRAMATATAAVTSTGRDTFPLSAYLNEAGAGMRTNSRMPAVASTKQSAIAVRKGVSGIRTAVSAHWGKVEITDVYSGSARGQTAVTCHVLLSDVLVIQPGAYEHIQYRVS